MKAQDLYQAAHHELVASALATKIGHEIDSENKIGCMVLGLTSYPRTCNPDDVIATMEESKRGYFFTDIHMRGYYPSYALKMMEKEGVVLDATDEDLEMLKIHVTFYHLVTICRNVLLQILNSMKKVKEI